MTAIPATYTPRPVNLRGKAYYAELKRLLAEIGPAIVADVHERKAKSDNGKMKVRDLGQLCLKYNLNFKALVQFLEDQGELRVGCYEWMIDGGLKPRALLAQVAAEQQEEV